MSFSRLAESALFCADFAVPCGFDLLGMCNTSVAVAVKTDSV